MKELGMVITYAMLTAAACVAYYKITTLANKVEVLEAKLVITAEYAKQLGAKVDSIDAWTPKIMYCSTNTSYVTRKDAQ